MVSLACRIIVSGTANFAHMTFILSQNARVTQFEVIVDILGFFSGLDSPSDSSPTYIYAMVDDDGNVLRSADHSLEFAKCSSLFSQR